MVMVWATWKTDELEVCALDPNQGVQAVGLAANRDNLVTERTRVRPGDCEC